MMKSYLLTIVIAISALTLSGCGRDKADAMKNYRDLPLTNKKGVQSESIDKAKVFKISCLSCEQDGRPLIFNDSEEGQIKFKLEILDSTITSASLRMQPGSEIPGATLTPSPNSQETGIWYFKWKPNQILAGPMDRKEIALRLEARSLEVKSTLQLSFLTVEDFILTIVPSRVRPIIQSDTVPASLEQGQAVPFTVTVFDPSTQGRSIAPALQILPYKGAVNAENPRHDGSQMLRVTSVSSPNSTGAFTYVIEMNTEGVKLPKESDPRTDSANMCFSLNVMSASTHNSAIDPRPYCVRVKFAIPTPRINWLSGSKTGSRIQELTAGIPNEIKFEVFAPGDKGIVSSKTNIDKSWPSEKGGEPQIICDPAEDRPTSKKTCTVTWTPQCKLAPNGQTLKNLSVKMTNRAGNITRIATDDVMALVITKVDEAACTKKTVEVRTVVKADAKQESQEDPGAVKRPETKIAANPEVKTEVKQAAKTKVKKPKKKPEAPTNPAAPVVSTSEGGDK